MSKNSIRCLFLAAMTLTSAGLQGCSQDRAKVNIGKAEAALDKVLDAWTRGEPLDKFAGTDQAIQVTEPDWKAGYRLKGFLGVNAKSSPDATEVVHCRVALALQDQRGKKVDKEVLYNVTVGVSIIIRRDSAGK